MVRYNILDKGLTFNTQNDKRFEISLYSIEDKKVVYKIESGKLTGKFSQTIEKCIFFIVIFLTILL